MEKNLRDAIEDIIFQAVIDDEWDTRIDPVSHAVDEIMLLVELISCPCGIDR